MIKQEMHALLDQKFSDIINHVNGKPASTFAVGLTSGKWSDGEHLEHLRKSTRAVNKGMAMPKLVLWYKFGKIKRIGHSYEELKGIYYDKLGGGVKAPLAFTPKNISNLDKEKILIRLNQEKETMQNVIKNNSAKALNTYGIKHPALGPLSFKEFVYFTAFHTEHHFKLLKRDNG